MRTPTPWVLPSQPIARADLLASGVTARMLRTRLGSGDLVQVRRGVYLRTDAWPTDAAGRHVVSARAGQTVHTAAVVSHQSAALILGLPTPGFGSWEEQPVSVTLPVTGHSTSSATAIHHTGPLPAGQVQRDKEGYLVTTPARTAVDLAADLPLPEALVLLDSAARLICASLVNQVRRRDYANPQLVRAAVELLEQAATTVRATRLRPVLALVNPSRESVAESLSAGHMQLVGLPTPLFQAEIRTPMGKVYPDFLWEDLHLIGECDGAVKYDNANAYVLEREREQMLRDLGYRFVRWLAKEIMLQPAVVMERIARALAW
jgi:very-short-patch-repair endonuclease